MPTMAVLLTMMLILLFMGAFMDWIGIVLLIIPVFLPIVQRLPIEEIGLVGQLEAKYVAVWFGVLFFMNMQFSFLSPPFGPAALLPEIGSAPANFADRFFQGIPALHLHSASGACCDADLAADHRKSSAGMRNDHA